MKRTIVQLLLVLLVLSAAAGAAGVLIRFRKPPEKKERKVLPPLVRVLELRRSTEPLIVRAHGTVEPHMETILASQVAGRIVRIAGSFQRGGRVEKDQVLVEIDRRDYQLAVDQARARVAEAETHLAREEAEARLAREEWKKYGEGEPDPLVLREPQLAEARSRLEAARAALQQAQLNLERTMIRAPYAGRVRGRFVGVGQVVSPGTALGRIYAVDYVEIPLAVHVDDLRFLGMPLIDADGKGCEVRLSAEVAGIRACWKGRIVRTGAEIDRPTRMIHLIARVDGPYQADPPLLVGTFVEAEIIGRVVPDVFVVPRDAVRGNRVAVVDEQERLRFRTVEVLRRQGDRALLRSGVREGERLMVSPLQVMTEGMAVRIHQDRE